MAKGKRAASSGDLFIEPSGQLRLTDRSAEQRALESRRIECLGISFESDAVRRAHFTEQLREKLQDPTFRSAPGFPAGDDEDILALSDPPYYTACPNPFLEEFIKQNGKSYSAGDAYNKGPFAADVSEGRTEDIYAAHTYHTKVPPKAIARYIFHYTAPGDLVLDVFAGSGMTGVAAALCADRAIAAECRGEAGARNAILCDLSPVATFISSVYLDPPDAESFADASERLLLEADKRIGELWIATDNDGRQSRVEFQVWTEIFTCPLCQETVSSQAVVEATEEIGTAKEFPCPHCDGLVSKAPSKGSNASKLERRLRNRMDPATKQVSAFLPRAPLFAQVRRGSERVRVPISDQDRTRLEGMALASPFWFPVDDVIEGERFKVKDCCYAYGISRIHHFYLPRQLVTYSCLWDLASRSPDPSLRNALKFFVQSNALGMTVLNRFGPTHYSQVSRYFSGTLYVPSMVSETSHRYTYEAKRKRLIKVFAKLRRIGRRAHAITTQSSTRLGSLPDNCVDYVFIDPPFGRNLQYSELNQIWEAWLRVRTDRGPEAVMDATRHREAHEYTSLMRAAFKEVYRVLKPGRWMTVEFHNSSNAVWTAIQEAIVGGGFVVADVRTLSKESDTYKQSRQGLVKQDLVISAYKPNGGLEQQFRLRAGTAEGAWDFVRQHLKHLPVFVEAGGKAESIAERQPFLLFDRMIAFHIQRGATVPMGAAEFYRGLAQRFPERDGMYFLPEQVAEYDRRRLQVKEIEQFALFVNDERSAIQWLRQQLEKEPQTYQRIQPKFLKELHKSGHEQLPELQELLAQSFLQDEKQRWYVPDPNAQIDLEKLREKTLLQEFEEYKASKQKRLKVFRTEAIRAGFKAAWAAREYQTIISVADRLPEDVVQEDPTILMYFDNASMRVGG